MVQPVLAPRGGEASREAAFGELTSRPDFELRTLAADTGGRAFFPSAVGELAAVYDSIASELAHQYSLGYLSSKSTADGKFRRILVRVLAPGLRWRARSGYLAGRVTRTFSDR